MGHGMCGRCGGIMKIVTGALLLLNGFVWPQWLGIDGWLEWIGVLLVLGGLARWLIPNTCMNCAAGSAVPKKGKK